MTSDPLKAPPSGSEIREAREGDFDAVAELMTLTLEPYYGGDHRRHAERIFSTHISGGQDRLGFFSTEQKMFVATVDGVFAAMIHVVGKRQRTYKISPLIVHPDYRASGIGQLLLDHAEQYARDNGARQMYCTVAVANDSAFKFFVRNGYIRAGESASHYKSNIDEAMMYKVLELEAEIFAPDTEHISITPFDQRHEEDVRRLLLEHLPSRFAGIDDGWVDSLFDGYQRRNSQDVNSKYKLIFVATDSQDKVRGVAGATPKKGTPIKLMPVVSEDSHVFEALLRDVPYMLKEYGHKLYIHVQPSARETISLQKLDWELDAVMPEAYGDDTVTQQWSFNLKREKMRNMRMKRRFFELIMKGSKTLEVRVGYDQMLKIAAGDLLRLSTQNQTGVIEVLDVRRYPTFAEMLQKEDASRIAPDEPHKVAALLREIYPPHKEALGVLVFEIRPAVGSHV